MSIRKCLTGSALCAATVLASQSASFAQSAVPPLFAILLGGNEVAADGTANAGDQDGRGSATVLIRGTTLCYAIVVNGIGKPTLAHIHRQVAGLNGDIVVPLDPPATGNAGTASGCLRGLDANLLRDITSTPGGFYVNVHNDEFPAGALRGQLF